MVSAIVLAAGESTRMGSKKELMPIAGEPMIRMVVSKLLASDRIDELIVVLGHGANEVGAALAGLGEERLELVGNRRFAEGMGTSLALGASACSWGTDAIIVALADMPFFHTRDVEALIDAHDSGAAIVVPASKGRRGHPVLFDRSYREELEQLSGDGGAKHVLERASKDVREVELADDAFLVDVDDPEDYAAVKDGIEPR
jgi:molybdenum cofactor cytidylyltransferase